MKGNSTLTHKQVSQIVNSKLLATMEIKRYSQITASYAGSTAGTITPLTQALIIGDTISGRTGDVISPRKVEINLSIIAPATSTVPVITRYLVIQDMLNTGTAVTIANVLDGAVYNSSYALYPNQQHRFKILVDKSTASVLGGNNMAQMLELRFKMRGRIFYNGDTNAAGSNGAGSLWLITINSSAGAGIAPNIEFYSSITFTDA